MTFVCGIEESAVGEGIPKGERDLAGESELIRLALGVDVEIRVKKVG